MPALEILGPLRQIPGEAGSKIPLLKPQFPIYLVNLKNHIQDGMAHRFFDHSDDSSLMTSAILAIKSFAISPNRSLPSLRANLTSSINLTVAEWTSWFN
jgi:hypothetical protein